MSDELNFILHLPEDIIFKHILIKLPAKSLLTCTRVCKTWDSFIKSPVFVSSHLNQNETDYFLRQLCSLPVPSRWDDKPRGMTDRFFLHSKDQELNLCEELHFPYQIRYGFQVLASCNGLVLLMHGQYPSIAIRLILWNPLIMKFMVIGSEDCPDLKPLQAIGLGFDSKTRDYKILTITKEIRDETKLMVLVYSLKANSWKRLPDIEGIYHKYGHVNRGMVYLNGALYFVASRRLCRKIMRFDLCDEVFHEIRLPGCIPSYSDGRGLNRQQFYLCIYRESLAILRCDDSNGVVNIWAMKQHGVEVSWTHLSTFRLESLGKFPTLEITGLMFINDSRVILSFGSTGCEAGSIFLHDLNSQETEKMDIVGEHNCVFLGGYVESLVLLDKGNELRRYIADFVIKEGWNSFQVTAEEEA